MTNCTIHVKGAMDFIAWKERIDIWSKTHIDRQILTLLILNDIVPDDIRNRMFDRYQ